MVWVVVEVPVVTSKRPEQPYPRDKKQSSLVVEVLVDTQGGSYENRGRNGADTSVTGLTTAIGGGGVHNGTTTIKLIIPAGNGGSGGGGSGGRGQTSSYGGERVTVVTKW